jgi:dTDP-4-amino-4,6-dideoxygalactose transaminase
LLQKSAAPSDAASFCRRKRAVVASSIEHRLGRLFGYEHAILFGRARAGLAAVLEEVGGRNSAVVFPSNVCVAVLAATVAAKKAPRLAAVSPQSGLADDDRLAEAIMTVPKPGIVMPTHTYGQLAEYGRTRQLAAERGWFVLENDSLAATISREHRFRAFGDALLISFGSGKTIDAGGGGAILTNDKALASALARRASQWPVFDAADDAMESNLVLARRHLQALGRETMSESLLDLDVACCRQAFNILQEPRVAIALDEFDTKNARRLARLARWGADLKTVAAELSAPMVPTPTPWRAVFRFAHSQLRDAVVNALRRSGFDAGTNYPPLTDFFPNLLRGQSHADAERWGQTVMTLWLDQTYDDPRIAKAAAVIEMTVAAAASAVAPN